MDGFVRHVTEPLGKMWLASLIMVVIPLIAAWGASASWPSRHSSA